MSLKIISIINLDFLFVFMVVILFVNQTYIGMDYVSIRKISQSTGLFARFYSKSES